MMRAQVSRVLQGYFRIEQLRGVGRNAAVAQRVATRGGIVAPALRSPDLLPAKLRAMVNQPRLRLTISDPPRADRLPAPPGAIGQPSPAHVAARTSSQAARPGALPGMGAASVGGPRRSTPVAQARASHGVVTTPVLAGQLRVIGEGRAIEPGIRGALESFFQADFSGVRVHEGPAAQAMGALAFTLGDQLPFAPGQYDATSHHGIALLGHELAHVLQQREGRVANPYGRGVAIVQDPALEAEADALGRRAADEIRGEPSSRGPAWTGRRARSAAAVQRSRWDDIGKVPSTIPFDSTAKLNKHYKKHVEGKGGGTNWVADMPEFTSKNEYVGAAYEVVSNMGIGVLRYGSKGGLIVCYQPSTGYVAVISQDKSTLLTFMTLQQGN